MPQIQLKTEIHAPVERCFDLARSIDLHKISTAKTNEEAVAGTTSGLIGLHETVTWRATHLGVRQHLTSRITAFQRPHFFTDEQVKGIFKQIYHEHRFEQVGNRVIITDIFHFRSPFGIAGRIFNAVFLTSYLRRLLIKRNQIIREFAETDAWKQVLPETK